MGGRSRGKSGWKSDDGPGQRPGGRAARQAPKGSPAASPEGSPPGDPSARVGESAGPAPHQPVLRLVGATSALPAPMRIVIPNMGCDVEVLQTFLSRDEWNRLPEDEQGQFHWHAAAQFCVMMVVRPLTE